MSDAICRKCNEPWEMYYLAHEGLYDHPGDAAPNYLKELHHQLVKADDKWYDEGEVGTRPRHYDLGGKQLQRAVLIGEGCPACWENPEHATNTEEDSIAALRHNLFDSAFDGDPADLF